MSKQQAPSEQELEAKESQLNMRHVGKLPMERTLAHSKVRIEHLELKCERNNAMSKLKWPLTDVGDDRVRKLDETRMNEQFEAKLNQLAVQIGNFDKLCVNCMTKMDDLDQIGARLEATKLASEPPNDSGLTALSSSSSYGHDEYVTRSPPASKIEAILQQDEEEYDEEEDEEYDEQEYLGEGDYQQDPDCYYQQANYEYDLD